jgi:hypothetical protein
MQVGSGRIERTIFNSSVSRALCSLPRKRIIPAGSTVRCLGNALFLLVQQSIASEANYSSVSTIRCLGNALFLLVQQAVASEANYSAVSTIRCLGNALLSCFNKPLLRKCIIALFQ